MGHGLAVLTLPHQPPVQVSTVYMLVRARKNVSAAKRVQDLLCSPLFNMLHQDILSGKRNPFSRVHPVEGDLTKPGLGLSHQDLRLLRANVSVVLHCGALIELDADVQKTLRWDHSQQQCFGQGCMCDTQQQQQQQQE